MIIARLLGVALAVAVAVAATQSWRLHSQQRDHALELAKAAKQAVADERAARAKERRLRARVQEPATHDRLVDAPARRVAADRLHVAAAELLAAATVAGGGATGDPGDSERGAPAAGAGLVSAELLGRCVGRVEELATWADAAHAAGRVCERGWDAMTGPPQPSSQAMGQ